MVANTNTWLDRRRFLAGVAGCVITRSGYTQPSGDAERRTVVSADGTEISYLRIGQGPSVVIAPGGLEFAVDYMAVASSQAPRATCYVMDRRGRGESGVHGAQHSVAEEAEDIHAVMQAAGAGSALFGHSSGAVFALEAALRFEIGTLILYEPPVPLTEAGRLAPEMLDRYRALIASGDLDEALQFALRVGPQVPESEVAQMRAAPNWSVLTERAPAWLGDFEALAPLPAGAQRYATIGSRTLLIRGSESPAFLRDPIDELDSLMPDSRILELPGQQHIAHILAPHMLGAGIAGFLGE